MDIDPPSAWTGNQSPEFTLFGLIILFILWKACSTATHHFRPCDRVVRIGLEVKRDSSTANLPIMHVNSQAWSRSDGRYSSSDSSVTQNLSSRGRYHPSLAVAMFRTWSQRVGRNRSASLRSHSTICNTCLEHFGSVRYQPVLSMILPDHTAPL